MVLKSCALAVLAVAAFGCQEASSESGRKPAIPPTADQLPLTVAVASADLEVGFQTGVLRKNARVTAFRLSRYPTTVGQFKSCVAAGGCQVPPAHGCEVLDNSPVGGPNYSTAAPDVPVTCVGPGQAKAYCAWVGGTLPSLEQWMAAARGCTVRRWPWGATPPTCDQHPLGTPASQALGPAPADAATPLPCKASPPSFAVGQHPRSASPAGVEDLLITRSELVSTAPKHLYQACSEPFQACGVHGVVPGAIDAVEPVREPSLQPQATDGAVEHVVDHPYSFRCAWSQS